MRAELRWVCIAGARAAGVHKGGRHGPESDMRMPSAHSGRLVDVGA